MTTYPPAIGLGIAVLVVRAASAQAVPAQAVPAQIGPADPPDGHPAASQPVLEPEHVTPAKPPADADEPITADQLVIGARDRVDLNFFGDVSFAKETASEPGFLVGPLVFQVTAHLSEGLVGRSEIEMDYDDGETVVDVERAYLEYRTAHWTLSAGRSHAEFGYWDNAFHHGRWLQLTINRPHVLRFEDQGGMLQVHDVGVTAVYGPARGDAGVEASFGVSNGHGRTLDQAQTNGDDNLAKSLVVRLGMVGIGDPSLRFGLNFAFDVIAPEPAAVRPLAPDVAIQELVTGAYLSLRAEHLIVFAETYNVLHRAMGRSWKITDGFFLAGYRLGSLIPYGQVELRRGDGASDPFYNPAPAIHSETPAPLDYTEGIAGLHYDINSWNALKLELTARNQPGPRDYRAELNWSFGR